MKHLRVILAAALERLSSWGPCGFCGERHDPSDHWPLFDDIYE